LKYVEGARNIFWRNVVGLQSFTQVLPASVVWKILFSGNPMLAQSWIEPALILPIICI
jgi:hypothetical protein